jgi:hypothetical protein
MHTQRKEGSVQFAVTLIWATTKAGKKNKDMNGGATERIRRDISYPKVRVVGGCRWNVAWQSNASF